VEGEVWDAGSMARCESSLQTNLKTEARTCVLTPRLPLPVGCGEMDGVHSDATVASPSRDTPPYFVDGSCRLASALSYTFHPDGMTMPLRWLGTSMDNRRENSRIEQAIIPQVNSQYLEADFWEKRYSQYVRANAQDKSDLATRDWLANYSAFADIFRKHVDRSASILILGLLCLEISHSYFVLRQAAVTVCSGKSYLMMVTVTCTALTYPNR